MTITHSFFDYEWFQMFDVDGATNWKCAGRGDSTKRSNTVSFSTIPFMTLVLLKKKEDHPNGLHDIHCFFLELLGTVIVSPWIKFGFPF